MINNISFRLRQNLFLKLACMSFSLITFSISEQAVAGVEPVQINARVSQKLLVQNGDNTVYLDITIKAPTRTLIREQPRATDMLIILDRSGSMHAEKR